MKVETKIKIYERDGKENYDDERLEVESHWNYDTLVIISFKGENITVSAKELKKAIDCCSGWK